MASSPDSSSDSPPPPPPPDSGDSSSSGDSPSSSPTPSPPPPPPSSPPPSSPPPQSPPPSSPPPSSPPPPSDSGSGDNNNNNNPSPPPPSDQNNGGDNNNNNNSSPSPPPPSNNNGGGNNNNAPSPPAPVSNTPGVFKAPPPPPHHRLSPAKSTGSNNGGDSGGGGGSSSNVPVIVGVVLGAGLLLVLFILIFVVCSRRKKRSQSHIIYYANPNDEDFYKHPAKGNNNYKTAGGGEQHVMNIPPPPGGGGGGGGGWRAPAPAAGLSSGPMQSGEMSSASYSGGPMGPPPHPTVALGFNNKSTFSLEELAAATNGFAQANLLGQGGFGYVHKGVLPNGKEIAVKSLKSTGGQGDKEFQAEVDIISRVHHRHLVSLVGYCLQEGQSLLVYEFVPNNTMEYHLHGKGRPVMDWSTRLKIAIGSAKGLAYLHEDCHPRIIHRDIKGANILIDNNFEAKVADFGLAKFTQDNYTHVSTRVMGTFGYLAPEYASSGKLTEKSDVFSYGIMLLELITGRPPIDTTGQYEDSLVDWARPLCVSAMEKGSFDGLADPRLENNYDVQEMARMVACAGASVRHSARRRPKMSQIVRALEGDVSLDDLSEGVKPGQSSIFSNNSVEYSASTYSADMKRFRKLALESGYGSSEFGQTSEYGLNPSESSGSEQSSADYGKQK